MWQHQPMLRISSGQAVMIREWLEKARFEKAKGESEEWKRDTCTVRITPGLKRIRVDVRHLDSEWRSMGQILMMRADWPGAATMSPIELATSPEHHDQRRGALFIYSPGAWIYKTTKPWAHLFKVILQMLVGIGAVVAVASRVLHSVTDQAGAVPFAQAIAASVDVIAYALAIAAAIELAYTLFTPGPDEALDPLMLGLSAGILLLLTKPGIPVGIQYAGVIIGVLALGGLFLIRRYLIADEDG